MNSAVAALPSGEGRNVRGPVARLTKRHGEHDGDVAADDEDGEPQRHPIGQPEVGQGQDDERRHQQQLVGRRVEPGPERGPLLARRATSPSSASVRTAAAKITSAQPKRP